MKTIRIPNRATYSPVSLMDLVVAAPMASRLLLRSTAPGRVVQAVALGAYVGSAARDWARRRGVRPIDFRREFGADVDMLRTLPRSARETEVRHLAARLNDEYVADRPSREEVAREVDRHLTDYIASITGQRVETSARVRDFTLAKIVFPFALGACDIVSGDVAIFRDTGVLEPHVIAHEFAHRKGYLKELEAQALAYLALTNSGEPVLVQSALAERFHRGVRVLAGDDERAFRRLLERLRLRAELRDAFLDLRSEPGRIGRHIDAAMRALYDARMRRTGQNGLSDYDRGFTDFLYTFETSATARRTPPASGVVWVSGEADGEAG